MMETIVCAVMFAVCVAFAYYIGHDIGKMDAYASMLEKTRRILYGNEKREGGEAE